jgi:hypothetical protein
LSDESVVAAVDVAPVDDDDDSADKSEGNEDDEVGVTKASVVDDATTMRKVNTRYNTVMIKMATVWRELR